MSDLSSLPLMGVVSCRQSVDRWYVNNDVDPIGYLHILVSLAIRVISALTLERECSVGTKTNEFN